MRFSRRHFLEDGLAGTAGILAGGCLAGSAAHASAGRQSAQSTDPVAPVALGKHLKVSRIGMGLGMRGWKRESNLTRRGIDHAERVVRYAYDQGIRFFDNADLYGSHQYVARALRGLPRESYCLATKVWLHPRGLPEPQRQDADAAVKRFLQECETEYLDLVQLHCMMRGDWPEQMRRQMEMLEALKEKGLVRAHGISCHAISAIETAAACEWVDAVHARVNPFKIKTDGPPEDVIAALKKVHNAGKGVVAMKVIGEGALSKEPEKIDRSIRFALGSGAVDVMIVGFETTEDIDDFKARVQRALQEAAA